MCARGTKAAEQWIKDVISIVLFSYSHSMDTKRLYRWTVVFAISDRWNGYRFVCEMCKYIAANGTINGHISKIRGLREICFFFLSYSFSTNYWMKEGWFSMGYFRHSFLTGRFLLWIFTVIFLAGSTSLSKQFTCLREKKNRFYFSSQKLNFVWIKLKWPPWKINVFN